MTANSELQDDCTDGKLPEVDMDCCIDDLFLFETVLSEQNTVHTSCRTFQDFVEYILKNGDGLNVPRDRGVPINRFGIFDIICDLYSKSDDGTLDIGDQKFALVLEKIEEFLNSRNPYLLNLIRKE